MRLRRKRSRPLATTIPPTTPDAAPRAGPTLKVHVLGARKGESIVLELPDGRWGVIDCYARNVERPDSNPTVRFLRQANVERLEFVCLTHPHDDHFRGMSDLFVVFPVAQFWRFGSWSRQQLRELLFGVGVEAKRGGKDETRSADDLRRTLGLVRDRSRQRGLRFVSVTDCKMLLDGPVRDGPRITIRSVAPSSARAEAYQAAVLRHAIWERDLASAAVEPPRPRHNEISIALVVEFGAARLVLGGDVDCRLARNLGGLAASKC